ncbi:hypothetical protein X772_32375 [Mesorhizobium sp. LSJC280B00]|nr:hypothetical protein X772_32375 [Mesorhizobium sp. LSJC280B00]
MVNEQFEILRVRERLLPIKVSTFFKRKVDEEIEQLGHTEGPLHRMVYPTNERLNIRAPGEVPDFVDDRVNMPPDTTGNIIQKYRDRILYMPTSTCVSHCQYCFRQDVLSEPQHSQRSMFIDSVEQLSGYLDTYTDAEEVILSGGDPMTLTAPSLAKIFEVIKAHRHIRSIRIHTKAISYNPQLIIDERKLGLLSSAGVRLVFHLTHPYEICDEVKEAIAKIRQAGIRCYNQFPILRQINDHHVVLLQHLEQLDQLGIRNLSIFVPDPINFSAPFRINLARLIGIIERINWFSPSWINSTRFVMDTRVGKVRREDINEYNLDAGVATFNRDGNSVAYPDFPAELDVPGNLEIMLWRGNVTIV